MALAVLQIHDDNPLAPVNDVIDEACAVIRGVWPYVGPGQENSVKPPSCPVSPLAHSGEVGRCPQAGNSECDAVGMHSPAACSTRGIPGVPSPKNADDPSRLAVLSVNDLCAMITPVLDGSPSPAKNQADTTIDLTGKAWRRHGDVAVLRLAEAWNEGVGNHVTFLDLSLNDITSQGAIALADAIARRPAGLQTIELDRNKLCSDAGPALGRMVVGSVESTMPMAHVGETPDVSRVQSEPPLLCRLHRVDLSCNNLRDQGVSAFVSEVRPYGSRISLRELVIRSNDISTNGMFSVLDWLCDSSCPLWLVDAGMNNFDEQTLFPRVGETLTRNIGLRSFMLNSTMREVANYDQIVEALQHNDTLLRFGTAMDGKKRTVPAIEEALLRNRHAVLDAAAMVDNAVEDAKRKSVTHLNELQKVLYCGATSDTERLSPEDYDAKIEVLRREVSQLRRCISALEAGKPAKEVIELARDVERSHEY